MSVWPYVRITSVNDGLVAQAGTARTMAQLVSLIATRRLLDTASCDQMLDRLGRAAVGPDQPWADRPGILRPGCITHNKLGLGPLKSGSDVRSEVSVLTDPTGSGRTYVVTWQNLIGMRPMGFADVATLIRDSVEEFERP
jgi:hypothetical protein